MCGRLVEHQDRLVGQQGAGYPEPCPFATGDLVVTLTDEGAETVWKPVEPGTQVGSAKGGRPA